MNPAPSSMSQPGAYLGDSSTERAIHSLRSHMRHQQGKRLGSSSFVEAPRSTGQALLLAAVRDVLQAVLNELSYARALGCGMVRRRPQRKQSTTHALTSYRAMCGRSHKRLGQRLLGAIRRYRADDRCLALEYSRHQCSTGIALRGFTCAEREQQVINKPHARRLYSCRGLWVMGE